MVEDLDLPLCGCWGGEMVKLEIGMLKLSKGVSTMTLNDAVAVELGPGHYRSLLVSMTALT